jgi:hypothetical protein
MSRHSPEARSAAVALAAALGPTKAAKQLGLPVRTVAYWTHQPTASPIIADAERSIAERLVAAHEKALEAVEAGLTDPTTRLSDRAAALRTLGDQAALAYGRATANIAIGGQRDEDVDRLPPELQVLMREAWEQIFVLFLDKHGRGTQRVVCDGERVWTEGEPERPWLPDRLQGPNAGMVSSLPAPFIPEASERRLSDEPTITVRRVEEPAPQPVRRRLADRNGIIR